MHGTVWGQLGPSVAQFPSFTDGAEQGPVNPMGQCSLAMAQQAAVMHVSYQNTPSPGPIGRVPQVAEASAGWAPCSRAGRGDAAVLRTLGRSYVLGTVQTRKEPQALSQWLRNGGRAARVLWVLQQAGPGLVPPFRSQLGLGFSL